MGSKALTFLFIICLIQYCGLFEAEARNVVHVYCSSDEECQNICPIPDPNDFCDQSTHLCVCRIIPRLKKINV
nr:unnamed protein product [Ipomoea batatas]